MSISKKLFGKNGEGKDVYLYTLTNRIGASVSVLTHGGTLQSIIVPDKNGQMADVCLGFDEMGTYMIQNGSIGAFIGRYGNRIKKGRFTLDGKTVQLNLNNGANHLHGGPAGYQVRLMEAEAVEGNGIDRVKMSLHSPDGEENYPGSLDMTVTYSFDDDCNLAIDYTAVTDSKTVLNLTNHCYFNLAGHDSGSIADHLIRIDADCVTRVDEQLIPTGDYTPVAGTPLDLRAFKRIGDGIEEGKDYPQMIYGMGGYDHNFVLGKGSAMGLCTVLKHPASGRVMEVITDQPGIQFYSGNQLKIKGKGGADYKKHDALCLETQHFPDSPNNPHFPSTVLCKGETFHSTTIYAFKVEK